MKILVVGGAGYIGSHMVKTLYGVGCEVLILDDLSSGSADVSKYGELVVGDFGNRLLVDELLKKNVTAVMHFASHIEVAESMSNPRKYYANNLSKTLSLLDAMVDHNIKNFIFSSTAATFGEPKYIPIDEKHPQFPINPYGKSKLMVEQILEDYDSAYGMKSVCLRYFNAAGADPDGEFGECHEPETHLIPLVLQTALGLRSFINVFGRDYDTEDGTCMRDYIHVSDLCSAHWLALQALISGGDSERYNLGNGSGFSVQEVIDTALTITGRKINVVDAPRRKGDPAKLVADSSKAMRILSWKPKHPSLGTIIKHAWEWELSRVR